MRLYMYLDRKAYEALLADGMLVGSPQHSSFPEFADAYRWLAGLMTERVGPAPPHATDDWPVFAWYQMDGRSPIVYDLNEGGDDSDFLLGIEVPDRAVLLSDHHDWHYVLNRWYLPSGGSEEEDEREDEAFYRMCEQAGYRGMHSESGYEDPEVEAYRTKYWRRVVDRWGQSGWVQATMWEVRKEWVVLVMPRGRRHS